MSELSTKLRKLNSQVFVSEPSTDGGNKVSSDPSVIILFAWIDARLVHVQKYSDSLRNIFPTSTIIVVMVTSGVYFSTEKSKETLLAPVVDILHRERNSGNISKGVLLFVMSNGGGFQLVTLRKVLSKNPLKPSDTPSRSHPTAVIYDSTPGDNGLESAILSNAPSNPLVRLLVIPVITLAYGVLYAVNFLSGNRPLFEELRSTYLETDILPSISNARDVQGVPRLYIYSKKDRMTLSRNVESNIEQAGLLGLDISIEKFENSAHVAHARQDPERYWEAVRKVWLRASQPVQPQL